MEKQKMVMFFCHKCVNHKVSLLHRVWPFQAYKSHSSVWRILEVCNKRGYWTYVEIFFQKWNSECKILASCKFHKCSLEHIVLFKLIFQSQLIDIRTLHVVDRKEKIIFLIFLFQKHRQIIRISLTKKRLGRLSWMAYYGIWPSLRQPQFAARCAICFLWKLLSRDQVNGHFWFLTSHHKLVPIRR